MDRDLSFFHSKLAKSIYFPISYISDFIVREMVKRTWKLKLYNHFESQSFPCGNSIQEDPGCLMKKKKKMAQRAPHRNDPIGTRVAHRNILHPRRRVDGRSERDDDDEACARASLSGMPDLPPRLLHALTEIHTVRAVRLRGVINRPPSVCDSSGIPGRSIKPWYPIGDAWLR